MCPKPRIPFFWFTSIGVQKWLVLVEVSAPTRLALQGSHVWRLYQKRTPLRSESSTIKGLLYAHWSSCCKTFVARKVRTIALEWSTRKLSSDKGQMPFMAWVRWRSRCKAFVARKACTIAYEQSARKLSYDKWQSTYSRVWISLWWFHTQAVLHSLANARKCQLEDFCEEERYESCSVERTFTAETLGKSQKRENSMVVMLLPGSHKHLALRNPHGLFQKHGGTCTMY